ncbi:MAG: hypothetical protein ABI346_00715, partial [Candidatus Baltobacteraceae bacterium]
RQLIWDGLRALHARIDLAAYPVATFIVPSGWHGEGWKNEGFQLTRPGATLTDKALTIAPGAWVPLPFSRECASPPQFAVAGSARIPEWSRIEGLWRPVSRFVWQALLRNEQPSALDVRFVPRRGGDTSLVHVESFAVLARASGTFRLLAACANPHYDSVGVTWVDIAVRPAGARASGTLGGS